MFRVGERVKPATEHVDIGDELLGIVVADVLAEREPAAGQLGTCSIGEFEGRRPEVGAVGEWVAIVDAGRAPEEGVHVRQMRRDLRELCQRGIGG